MQYASGLDAAERATALLASATSADLRPARRTPRLVRLLVAAGAPVPERVGEDGPRAVVEMAALGVEV